MSTRVTQRVASAVDGGRLTEAKPLADTRFESRAAREMASADGFDWSGPVSEIDAALAAFCERWAAPMNLREAVEYSLLGGGKRVRPLFAWHAAVAVGGSGEASLPAGTAVELVHAFSLVHDDLPAIDNDDLRRGRPTLHKHAGETMAVLAGDAMLNFAYGALWEAGGAGLVKRLMEELARGTNGMIVGQVYDTLGGFEDGVSDERKLELIHRNKTGALIRASARMGALCGLAAENDAEAVGSGEAASGGQAAAKLEANLGAISAYSEAVGLIFQIVDDLIDVEQTSEAAGKRTGKDLEAGKLTYPGVLGVDRSRERVAALLETAISAVAPMGDRAAGLVAMARSMAYRDR